MSYVGEGPYDGVDLNDPIAVDEVRLKTSLEGAGERESVLRAIHLANGLEREIAGETPGHILHYLRDMQEEAIDAMAKLIGDRAMTDEQRMAARLKIQPYAHLMHWLKDKIAMARGAKWSLEDLNRNLDGQPED